MKHFAVLMLLLAGISFAHADLCMPKERNFYDQLGEGIANIAAAPAELLDSTYDLTMSEGPSAGYLGKGLVQGTSRMVMDVMVGIAEIITSPFAMQIGESLKSPAYDSLQVHPYPPADLYTNWY